MPLRERISKAKYVIGNVNKGEQEFKARLTCLSLEESNIMLRID